MILHQFSSILLYLEIVEQLQVWHPLDNQSCIMLSKQAYLQVFDVRHQMIDFINQGFHIGDRVVAQIE